MLVKGGHVCHNPISCGERHGLIAIIHTDTLITNMTNEKVWVAWSADSTDDACDDIIDAYIYQSIQST